MRTKGNYPLRILNFSKIVINSYLKKLTWLKNNQCNVYFTFWHYPNLWITRSYTRTPRAHAAAHPHQYHPLLRSLQQRANHEHRGARRGAQGWGGREPVVAVLPGIYRRRTIRRWHSRHWEVWLPFCSFCFWVWMLNFEVELTLSHPCFFNW